ncbi:hypothetical protein T459_26044 [Capsicum annuum]|uniref:H(+)-exporting diphosphatase n=1 Tax=Capsicum annuum TaxID=4072 RepID=A0A2G2YMI2_CAPAN|nr:hypothetical protein T459_26044 [Capsicum annuum]
MKYASSPSIKYTPIFFGANVVFRNHRVAPGRQSHAIARAFTTQSKGSSMPRAVEVHNDANLDAYMKWYLKHGRLFLGNSILRDSRYVAIAPSHELPSLALSVVQDASHRPMDITEVIPTHKNNRKSKHCVDPAAAITRRDNRDKDDFTHGEHRPRASIRHRSYGTGVMGLQFKHLSSLLACSCPWALGDYIYICGGCKSTWAMLPYWFSAMTMKSVGSAALKMVEEVRRQFNGIPGLMKGTTMSVLIFIDSHVAASQDKENGGISDRPDDAVDVFQTYFGVTADSPESDGLFEFRSISESTVSDSPESEKLSEFFYWD